MRYWPELVKNERKSLKLGGQNPKIIHYLMIQTMVCLLPPYMMKSTWDIAKTNILRHLECINHEILA